MQLEHSVLRTYWRTESLLCSVQWQGCWLDDWSLTSGRGENACHHCLAQTSSERHHSMQFSWPCTFSTISHSYCPTVASLIVQAVSESPVHGRCRLKWFWNMFYILSGISDTFRCIQFVVLLLCTWSCRFSSLQYHINSSRGILAHVKGFLSHLVHLI